MTGHAYIDDTAKVHALCQTSLHRWSAVPCGGGFLVYWEGKSATAEADLTAAGALHLPPLHDPSPLGVSLAAQLAEAGVLETDTSHQALIKLHNHFGHADLNPRGGVK